MKTAVGVGNRVAVQETAVGGTYAAINVGTGAANGATAGPHPTSPTPNNNSSHHVLIIAILLCQARRGTSL